MNLISLTFILFGQVQMIEHLYYIVSDKNIQYNTREYAEEHSIQYK